MTLPLILLVAIGANTKEQALAEYRTAVGIERERTIRHYEHAIIRIQAEQTANKPTVKLTKAELRDFNKKYENQIATLTSKRDGYRDGNIPDFQFSTESGYNTQFNVANLISGIVTDIQPGQDEFWIKSCRVERGQKYDSITIPNILLRVRNVPTDSVKERNSEEGLETELHGVFWITGKLGPDSYAVERLSEEIDPAQIK